MSNQFDLALFIRKDELIKIKTLNKDHYGSVSVQIASREWMADWCKDLIPEHQYIEIDIVKGESKSLGSDNQISPCNSA